ncbi:MAG: PAS domain S-box protein [Acidobacteria bacterium]|nr:MAG: PAS domain S-box protein [Acidobacteriota bacterium]RPJ84848.1 MAG: PAS domain S-box protein [Acidobacteriota bacterium]
MKDGSEEDQAADVVRELRENKARLDAVFEASRDGIIVEEDERIVYANKAYSELYGYDSPEQLLGRHVSEVQAPEDNERMLEFGRRRLAGETVPVLYEFKGRKRDGKLIDLEASVSLSVSEGRTRIVTVVRDIAERKRVEEQRRQFIREQAARMEAEASEQRAVFLAEAGAILASSLDYETTLATTARLAVPTLGDWCLVAVAENEGHVRPIAVAHPDPQRAQWAEALFRRREAERAEGSAIAEAIRTRRPKIYTRTAGILPGGSGPETAFLEAIGFASAMVVPMVARGRALGAIVLIVAESGRRYRLADLLLAQALAGRAAMAVDNALLHREVHQASSLKDEFLATLSHELRTPLNAILGWSRLLRAGRLSPEKQERALDAIERNAVAQVHLVSDILDVSRIITGRLRLDVRTVDMGSVIDAAVDSMRPAADAKGVRFFCTAGPSLPLLAGDPDRLLQVVWNLLSNAVKFTPRGGRIDLSLLASASQMTVRVSDTGIGIRRDFLPYVFDRFRQADPTPTRLHGGLGLGLSIVRHLVELHGGTVQAESAGFNRGATFVVTLPIAPPEGAGDEAGRPSQEAAPVSSPAQPRLAGIRVLVVDDDPDARELLATVLEHEGAITLQAASALEALASLEPFQPHLLIADIGMPGEDGYGLVRRLRSMAPAPISRIPAIAVTAYARPEDQATALSAGYTRHVPKPVDPPALLEVVIDAVTPRPGRS